MKKKITQEKSIEINKYLEQYFDDYLIIGNLNDKQYFSLSNGNGVEIGKNLGSFIHTESLKKEDTHANIIVRVAIDSLKFLFKKIKKENK